MPAYPSNPIGRSVPQAVPGLTNYLLGSLNRLTSPTKMFISTVALSGTTATVVGTVIDGNAPVNGQQVWIAGAVPSYFNVSGVVISNVTQVNTPDNGVYSFQFTLANSNIGTTASPGEAKLPQIEVGDSIMLGGTGQWFSAPLAIQSNTNPNEGRSVRADVVFPTLNGTCTVTMQTASTLDGPNDNFADAGTVVSGNSGTGVTSGSVVFVELEQNFIRFRISGTAGTGTVVGKILV